MQCCKRHELSITGSGVQVFVFRPMCFAGLLPPVPLKTVSERLVQPIPWGQPGRLESVVRALRRRCPVCGHKGISRHPAHVQVTCPHCSLNLERQVGSFIGGIGVNTVVSFVALIVVIVGGFIATGGEASVTRILLPALVVATLLPLLFYARSRLLWVAIELFWWPLEPGELASPTDS